MNHQIAVRKAMTITALQICHASETGGSDGAGSGMPELLIVNERFDFLGHFEVHVGQTTLRVSR